MTSERTPPQDPVSIAGLIDDLMRIARAAEQLNSAAGLSCAKSALAEAAHLILRRDPTPEAEAPAPAPPPELPPLLTVEQWKRKWCTPGFEGIPQPLDNEA
jgi:hypothetical protein